MGRLEFALDRFQAVDHRLRFVFFDLIAIQDLLQLADYLFQDVARFSIQRIDLA